MLFRNLAAVAALLAGATAVTPEASIAEALVVDSVVASVDGKPITLSDLRASLRPPRKSLSLDDLRANPELQIALDDLINRSVILEEAKQKRVGVSSSEIERYIDEVATTNSLTRQEFEKALGSEGYTIDSYRERVKVEILKSKLVGTVVVSTTAVSEAEVIEYLENQRGADQRRNRIQLRQLFISASGRTPEEFAARRAEVEEKIRDGKSFKRLIGEYSDAPDKDEDGMMPELPMSDLSPEVFEAVASLDEDEISDAVVTDNGVFFFEVYERRTIDKDEQFSAEEKTAARALLERERFNNKASTYFSSEIFKAHAVDKKI